ncbi:DIS3-like exonuclease 1 [Smittium mucronatum]|uniref:DIS3-like exonuclease 1 n=1 Tax=Smittium mucronatum TaxID=133383 RepID=A0A1R0GZM8_9FUNG|nr:DIS3-like exonuclease 1 [Smittium mucronatum]
MNEMPVDTKSNPWKPSLNDEGRLDIRNKVVFSIDPIGSLDIDDAISFETLKPSGSRNLEYELGVHIADASYFILPESASDLEARKRGNTIYLADRRFNMVPEILSENICSLRSGSPRYAVSVIWKLDESYNVLSVWFGRTLIKSVSEMSYESAQYILNGSGLFPSGEIDIMESD